MADRKVRCLNTEQKARIKEVWDAGNYDKTELAFRYGVSARTIGRVIDEEEQKEKEARKTPAEKLGYKVGDLFVVTKGKGSSYTFGKGDLVRFTEDDNSNCPRFEYLDGHDYNYIYLDKLEPHKEEVVSVEATKTVKGIVEIPTLEELDYDKEKVGHDKEKAYSDWWAGLSEITICDKYDIEVAELRQLVQEHQLKLLNQVTNNIVLN